MKQILENLFVYQDTCNVYLLRQGEEGVLIDFGSGIVMECLETIRVNHLDTVLITHHHRDQAQGLKDYRLDTWVPHQEQDLFHSLEAHWQGREVYNSYNNRQDRFSLLGPVPVMGTLKDYGVYTFADYSFKVLPTPGHTPGSITLLAEVDGRRIAFVGDLIAAPGKLWSLAATQWSYNGAEGVAATIASLELLKTYQPDLLLPSHGEVIEHPEMAIDLLLERLWSLLEARGEYQGLRERLGQPYLVVTPHLFWNRSSFAYGYVLLSKTGKALLFDYGYDFMTGLASGSDRAARRPWLYTLSHLKREFEIEKIDVVMPTHYHDDHVAGLNLLRDVEDTQVWAAENFAAILENPSHYNLPCLWYDPITVDRTLPLNQSVRWEEYDLQLFAQPGHTTHAVAIFLTVDGKRVVINGDQYQDGREAKWNYVYNNGFDKADYRVSAELYQRLQPDLILSGHWEPYLVEEGYLDTLRQRGKTLEKLHEDLLCETSGDEPPLSLSPYQINVRCGESFKLQAVLRKCDERAIVKLVLPEHWSSEEINKTASTREFVVRPYPKAGRRYRVGAELWLDGKARGQLAEALIDVADAV